MLTTTGLFAAKAIPTSIVRNPKEPAERSLCGSQLAGESSHSRLTALPKAHILGFLDEGYCASTNPYAAPSLPTEFIVMPA